MCLFLLHAVCLLYIYYILFLDIFIYIFACFDSSNCSRSGLRGHKPEPGLCAGGEHADVPGDHLGRPWQAGARGHGEV